MKTLTRIGLLAAIFLISACGVQRKLVLPKDEQHHAPSPALVTSDATLPDNKALESGQAANPAAR